jgi:hypothetical protein
MRRSESMCALGGQNETFGMPSGRVVSRSSLKTEDSSSDRSFSVFNVSFNTIEINEFPMEVGDNPSARGVPVQMGWESQMNTVLDLEEYETCKAAVEPRDRSNMMIPPKNRMELAHEQGLTMREIISVTREADKIKMYRSKSVENMNWDAFNENLEKTKRKLKKMAAKVPILKRRITPSDSVAQVEESPKMSSRMSFARQSSNSSSLLSSTAPRIIEEDSEETNQDFCGITF